MRLNVIEIDSLLEARFVPVNALHPRVDIWVVMTNGSEVALSRVLGQVITSVNPLTLKWP